MSNNYVFMIGAGASKHAGAPLMKEFLDRASDLADAEKHRPQDASTVLKAIRDLHDIHTKSTLGLRNLESVFSAIEMAELLGVEISGDGSTREALAALKRLIAWTLDKSMRYRYTKDGAPFITEFYSEFGRLLSDLKGLKSPKRTVDVITFNYDLALDVCLRAHHLAPGYEMQHDAERHIRLYKLHGSVGWFRCSSGCPGILKSTVQRISQHMETAELPWSELETFVGAQGGLGVRLA